LVLAAYGVYTALYLPGMLIGPPAPLLLVCFIAQAVFAIAAAVGLWTKQSWATVCVLVLGASIAATQLVEILLGIVPMLRAVFIAVLAIVGALLLTAWVNRRPVA
jgi:hypothetical protein